MTDIAHKLRTRINCCGTGRAINVSLVDWALTAKSPAWAKSICENMDKCESLGYNIGMLAFLSSLCRKNGTSSAPRGLCPLFIRRGCLRGLQKHKTKIKEPL